MLAKSPSVTIHLRETMPGNFLINKQSLRPVRLSEKLFSQWLLYTEQFVFL